MKKSAMLDMTPHIRARAVKRAASQTAHTSTDIPFVEISSKDFKKRGPIADLIDPRLTPVPAGPFTVEETRAFSGGWETAIRGSDGRRLCTVIEREHMPKESGSVRAAFIAQACNAYAALSPAKS